MSSIFQNKGRTALIVLLGGGAALAASKLLAQKSGAQRKRDVQGRSHGRSRVSGDFWTTFRKILKIILPSYASRESAYLGVLVGLLLLRSLLSIYMAEILGGAAEVLVSKQWSLAVNGILSFFLVSFPASLVNSALHYYTTILSLAFRVRLSRYVHDLYLNDVTFYNICNLKTEGELIDNVDQRIAVDIKRFSDELSELFTSTFKPVLDIFLFTWTLKKITSWAGPAILYGYFFATAFIKRYVMPSLGRLARDESRLDGDYRAAHQRLITNSEEVAFYDGSAREKGIINRKLDELKRHVILFSRARAVVSVLDNLLLKYWATIAGYMVQFAPVFTGLADSKTTEEMTRDYARNNRYITLLAEAIGQVVMLGNKISELSGHTMRVGGLLHRIETIRSITEPFKLAPEPISEYAHEADSVFLESWKQLCDRMEKPVQVGRERRIGNVVVREADAIEFSHIDIISPEGKLLVHNLSFIVRPGENVMVTGPNGAGKSSLFRIIGDLWPPAGEDGALLSKPPKEQILFVPQKPYLVLGTLRDQIIYPHTKEQMIARGITDDHLAGLLAVVDPAGTIRRNWPNWDVQNDWFQAFSGGQKQRVAMARLFYHRPRFAILDECTSAVSDEVEDQIYQTCRRLGITLFTVSHRKYLRRHHEFELAFAGHKGMYSWKKLVQQQDEQGMIRVRSVKEFTTEH